MAGRKTKYTPETVAKLTQAIRIGATYGHACAYAGISDETFARWRARYVEFVDAIKAAEGAAVVGWLAKIEQAANDGTWQAAAWKLERLYPQLYGRQVTELQGRDGGPIVTASADAGDGIARKLDELMERRRAKQLAAGADPRRTETA